MKRKIVLLAFLCVTAFAAAFAVSFYFATRSNDSFALTGASNSTLIFGELEPWLEVSNPSGLPIDNPGGG